MWCNKYKAGLARGSGLVFDIPLPLAAIATCPTEGERMSRGG